MAIHGLHILKNILLHQHQVHLHSISERTSCSQSNLWSRRSCHRSRNPKCIPWILQLHHLWEHVVLHSCKWEVLQSLPAIMRIISRNNFLICFYWHDSCPRPARPQHRGGRHGFLGAYNCEIRCRSPGSAPSLAPSARPEIRVLILLVPNLD